MTDILSVFLSHPLLLYCCQCRRYHAILLHCCSRWLGAFKSLGRSLQAYASGSASDRPKPILERMAWKCEREPMEQVAHVLDWGRGMRHALVASSHLISSLLLYAAVRYQ